MINWSIGSYLFLIIEILGEAYDLNLNYRKIKQKKYESNLI